MKIFIDNECKCHLVNDGTMTEIDAPAEFEGKCKEYIEGFRVRPKGYTYTRDDGVVFGPDGSSVTAWRDFNLLKAVQRQYESMLQEIQIREQALEIVGVTADD